MINLPPINLVSSKKRVIKWQIQRSLIDKGWFSRSFSQRPSVLRVLLISEKDKICQSQVFPFYYYFPELFSRWKIELKEIRLSVFEKKPEISPSGADIVLLQPWFNIDSKKLSNIFTLIKEMNPDSKTIFLDSYAPADLRLANESNDKIDLYIKKHVFRDRSQYHKPTRGDTNLVDYYGRLFNLNFSEKLYPIPQGFLDKLIIGPSFLTGSNMLPRFAIRSKPWSLTKSVDVHGRLAYKGGDWYQMMRTLAINKIKSLNGVSALSTTGVSRKQYFKELRSSKICFSPFGYGEVCWRDYEAILCGSLLIKPDMSHLETNPDIFIAHETYVPIKWDFSDFEEVVRYYLINNGERERIANNAYQVLHNYCKTFQFLNQVEPLFAA